MIKRIIRRTLGLAAVALGLAGALPVQAQFTSDIDIYSGNPSAADAPNVLIVLDNTANWSSAFTNEIAALVTTFNNLPVDRFRVGLMMFTESGGANSGPAGGYLRASSRLLDANYKTRMAALLNSFDSNADKSSGGKAGLTMAEAYYYLAGKAPYSGNNKDKTDFSGNTSGTAASNAIYALSGNALGAKGGSPYNSPVTNTCERNYIIYISNGPVQDNNSDTAEASAQLTAAYAALGVPRPPDMTLSPSGSQTGVSDEWARFMKVTPLNISTYTVDVNPGKTGQGPGWTALLKSMANSSGGDYFAVDPAVGGGAQLVEALNEIFNQIQSVNSVFSSASLPVSVSARGTYLNQIFMGMFRPDGDGNPRWRGNLKQYKFGYEPSTDTLFLADANGNPAITAATGFLSPSAVSFWSSTSTFWVNEPMGTPATASDSPDGEVVEKGGVAQKIRSAFATGQTTRSVFTCVACSGNTNLATSTATQFSTSTTAITAAMLGVSTTTERDQLINWVRGADNAGDESGPGGSVTVRPSVHGDVLHSRPAVVNYGTTTGVVVFYGSNDGMLRAVNGNTSGSGAGNELWSFVAAEHLPRLKRLRNNDPEIRLSTTLMSTPLTASSPTPRDYFVDGPISVYQKVAADGSSEKVVIFVTMRRGGRLLYALDVTNPAQPIFLWKKSQADMAVLGQTWSEPKVARIKGHTGPVLIMGAGYDAAAEDLATPGTTTMGNAVLVLDAMNGTLLRQFNTDRSVPADVALVDADFDGLVDRAYAVDLGGSIYRLDFEKGTSSTMNDWGMFKLASLAGSSVRKFFYPPDVIVTPNYAAVLAGSGDREKPLANSSADAFFTVYDTLTTKGTPASFTPITAANLGQIGLENDKTAGCFLPMNLAGEKIVNAPVTVAGITYFGTNRPVSASGTMCSANLGEAKVYGVPLFCKAPTDQVLTGGGLPPSPVTGTVMVSYKVTNPDGTETTTQRQVPFIIGAPNPKGSSIEGSKVKPTIVPVRKRSYWYLENAR
ncbi:MAG: PilC/PilY family type IV pilus protein [Hydrogenophaga sp.]|nr:PilC/PilY family type IV pilus protein [Hydrogenophaga sp.]